MYVVLKLHDLLFKNISTHRLLRLKFDATGLFSILTWSTRGFRVKNIKNKRVWSPGFPLPLLGQAQYISQSSISLYRKGIVMLAYKGFKSLLDKRSWVQSRVRNGFLIWLLLKKCVDQEMRRQLFLYRTLLFCAHIGFKSDCFLSFPQPTGTPRQRYLSPLTWLQQLETQLEITWSHSAAGRRRHEVAAVWVSFSNQLLWFTGSN